MQGSIRNNKNLNLTQNQILITIKQFWIKIPESNYLKTILNNKDNFEIRCSSVVLMGLQISTEAGKNTRTGSEFLPTISTWVANYMYLKKSKTTIFRDHYDCCVYNLCNVLIVLKYFRKLLPSRTCEIGGLRASNWLGGSSWRKGVCRLHELYNRWTFHILHVKRIRLPWKCKYVHKIFKIHVYLN